MVHNCVIYSVLYIHFVLFCYCYYAIWIIKGYLNKSTNAANVDMFVCSLSKTQHCCLTAGQEGLGFDSTVGSFRVECARSPGFLPHLLGLGSLLIVGAQRFTYLITCTEHLLKVTSSPAIYLHVISLSLKAE